MTARAALTLALWLPVAALAQSVAEPEDYENEHYRGPVPATLRGATVVDTETAHELWQSGTVIFVDVLPRAPKPTNLPEGTIWRETPRQSIPGAIWLPNVGYGKLADVTDAYFRAGLDKATNGDMDFPVLFFCLEECWMSWNAAKRAVEYGHTAVLWYPEGTDGWTFEDFPTEEVQPEPGY